VAQFWCPTVAQFQLSLTGVADPAGFVTDSALLCGLEYVARNKHIEVANLSLAGTGNQMGPCIEARRWERVKMGVHRNRIDKVHQRICRLTSKGVTVVAAAGNDAADAGSYTPAAYDEVIAVSAIADFDGRPGGLVATPPPPCFATEQDDHLATFSNYGAVVDIAAPGECVTSTFPGGLYATVEGTSFAAPLVSGAAALLYASHPGISPARVRAVIRARAEPGPIPGDPDGIAEGILDVASF
jgi:subtilisin